MKINLASLMSKISELESQFNELNYELKLKSINTKIIELNGQSQVIEEYPDFENELKHFMELADEITKLKGILFEKNNSIKLSNGKTIQNALIDVKNKRHVLELIKSLNKQNSYKKRTSETNNSYFTSKELAYNKEDTKKIEEDLLSEIQNIELEISKLNSELFEID